MLETMPHLTHSRCAAQLEPGEFHGHQSVTELEICADYYGAWEANDEAMMASIRHAEAGWLRHAEGGWDPMGVYVHESLCTPSGAPALEDLYEADLEAEYERQLDAYLAECPDA